MNKEDKVQTDDPDPQDNLESGAHLENVEVLDNQVTRDQGDNLEK